MPDLRFGTTELEVVNDVKLLGIIIQNDMKWKSNTANLVGGCSFITSYRLGVGGGKQKYDTL